MPDLNAIEEALGRIEVGIRQLKTQYDMFFAGAMPRQPFEVRKELEILIKTIGDTRMQRFADRYRYNSLAAKYQTMVELWTKMLRAKEEGRLRPGIPGFVEPVRRQAAAPAAPARPAGEVYRVHLSDPKAEEDSFRMFYDRYLEARRQSGSDGADRLSYSKFLKQIVQKTQAIKDKAGCETVTYTIVVKEDGVTLKARATKPGGNDK